MRVRKGAARAKARKRLKRRAKGYYGGRHKLRRSMKDASYRTGKHAYHGRKRKKRDMRAMWVTRINAALTGKEINYSRLINGLKRANIQLNRKMLSELAIGDPAAFEKVVAAASAALQG
jgi:large subunit ribosomal protein L20